MSGSSTTPGCPSACVGALGHIAFRYTDSVGTRNPFSIADQWLACTFPYRRFADILADACARLGADVVRYSFIVVDLYHLLLAGLPAHLCKNSGACALPSASAGRWETTDFWPGSSGPPSAALNRASADRGGSERRQPIKCTVTVIPLDERSKGRPDKQSDNAHLCCQFQHTVTVAAF
jgi:hypothetical protein